MTELLKRWASLEPERCRVSDAAAHLRSPFAFRIHWATLTADPINLAVVLAAVIEAIEARGGEWMVRAGPNLWVAGVSLTAGEDAYWDGQGDSRASATHALLAAYVAALEAEAGQ